MIDGLVGPIDGYPALPNALRDPIESGRGEWGQIDVAIASHKHRDHFDAGSVARFLVANPYAVFVSTPQAVRQVEELIQDPTTLARVHAILPAEGEVQSLDLGGVAVEVLNLHHGRRTPPVENLGVVVTLGGRSFLHFGDTEAKMETFEPYLDVLQGVDVALLPFWFLSSAWRAELVRDDIAPVWTVVGHLPTRDAPAGYFGRWNNYDELVATIRNGFPDAWIPQAPGESRRYGTED